MAGKYRRKKTQEQVLGFSNDLKQIKLLGY